MPWISRCLMLLAVFALLAGATSGAPLTYDVPRVSGITIDGNGADWGDKGLLISTLVTTDGNMPPPSDLDAKVRLGWNDGGLLVLVHVVDSADNEDPDETSLYKGDSVELYLAPSRSSGAENVQWIVGPGFDGDRPGLRVHLYDHRAKAVELAHPPSGAKATTAAAAIVKSSKTTDGYLIEAQLPWSTVFAGTPKPGATLAFQLDVNDKFSDGERQLLWYPAPDAYRLDTSMNVIRLVDGPAKPVSGAALAGKVHYGKIDVNVIAGASMAGHAVSLIDGARAVASGKLARDNGRARQTLGVPVASTGSIPTSITVAIDGVAFQRLDLPNYTSAREDRVSGEDLTLKQFLFTDDTFPVIDFANPGDADDVLGDYHIQTKFYNSSLAAVRAPEKPGRYGVVLKIVDQGGRTWRKYRTIYKLPQAIDWSSDLPKSPVKLAEAMGVDPAVAEANEGSIKDVVGQISDGNYQGSDQIAAVMGVLQAASPSGGKLPVWQDVDDYEWRLKKLAGEAPYPYMLALPDGYARGSSKLPLVLFLHGVGECGTDLELLKVQGPPKEVAHGRKFPFIMVAPQSEDTHWSIPELNDFLDQLLVKYRVDPDRVYLTGLSMGGFGTWDFATAHPERFAAVASFSGGGDPDLVAAMKNLPAWIVHGDSDPVVGIDGDKASVAALKAAGGDVKFTIVPGGQHDVWTPFYTGQEFYDWLLSHTRKHP